MEHGGRIHEYEWLTGRPPEGIVDASANINPLGPTPQVLQAIQVALSQIRYYPDPHHALVKNVLASKFDLPVEGILCGNGAAEVIELLFRYARPKRTFVLEPAFSEYEAAARRYGSRVQHVSLRVRDDFVLPLAELDAKLGRQDAVVLNCPHNPSGVTWAKGTWIDAVTEWSRRGVFVFIDESFIDFLAYHTEQTAMPEALSEAHIFVIRSATKMHAIPGLRFGFAVARPDHVQALARDRDGWSVNTLAQAAAIAAYQDHDFELRTWQWLADEHTYLRRRFSAYDWGHWHDSTVNYFLVRFVSAEAARMISNELEAQGIFLRDCSQFRELGTAYRRVAIKLRSDNERILGAVTAASYSITAP